MKKTSLTIALALLLSAPVALAREEVQVNVGADVHTSANARAGVLGQSGENRGEDNARATSSVKVDVRSNEDADEDENEDAHATTTDDQDDDKGELTSEAHRSAVASFVQSLRAVADRDGGIGAEVRAVAKSQNDSDATTTDAIAKVENRSALRTFFFGSDWEHLGMLRSQIAQDSADIAHLQAALDKSTNASVRADLEAHIDILEAEQARVEAFVTLHESTFSLFGWFTRLFS